MIPRTLLKAFAQTKKAYNKGTLKTGIWNAVKPGGFDYAIAGATVGYGMNDSSEDKNSSFISRLGAGVVDAGFGLGVGMALSGGLRGAKGIYNLGKGLKRDFSNMSKAAQAGLKATNKV